MKSRAETRSIPRARRYRARGKRVIVSVGGGAYAETDDSGEKTFLGCRVYLCCALFIIKYFYCRDENNNCFYGFGGKLLFLMYGRVFRNNVISMTADC